MADVCPSSSTLSTSSAGSVSAPGKKRILFVDDEPVMLELFRLMLEPMKDEWEIFVCTSGQSALQLLQQHSFEVVVSDMRMPGMSGAELLTKVMEQSPKTARIILSGYADQEQVAKSVGAAHQFLLKPCDFPTLYSTLTRVCALDVFLQNEALQTLAGKMTTLPSVPMIYFRLLKELQKPDSSAEIIGKVVAMDPSLSAKLLQLVNSAFFGISRKIANPVEAVQFLGVNTIRSLALTIQTFSCFEQSRVPALSINQIWNHSLSTGLVARRVAQLAQAEPPLADEAFIAGLLHDLGVLMLSVNMPKQYGEVIQLAQAQQMELWQAEEMVFGASHGSVGAYLLGLWGLPVSIVEAVALHHHPSKSVHRSFSPLTAVHLANTFEQARGTEFIDNNLQPAMDLLYLSNLGVRDFVSYWRDRVAEMSLDAAA